jgi:hypothetical protein
MPNYHCEYRLYPASPASHLLQKPPLEALGRLESWAQAAPVLATAWADLPGYNLGWWVRWLLSLVEDKELTPASREVYWTAAWRVPRKLHGLAVHDIDTSALWGFLRKNALPVPAISWRKLKVRFDRQPARVVTPQILAHLLEELEWLQKAELKTAAWLATRAALRVGEVCRLKARDLILEGLPYLRVARSKHGCRRVSLEHLRREELEGLS